MKSMTHAECRIALEQAFLTAEIERMRISIREDLSRGVPADPVVVAERQLHRREWLRSWHLSEEDLLPAGIDGECVCEGCNAPRPGCAGCDPGRE